MLAFEIHFTVDEIDGCFIVRGKDINVIERVVRREMGRRNLTEEKNNLWSLQIF